MASEIEGRYEVAPDDSVPDRKDDKCIGHEIECRPRPGCNENNHQPGQRHEGHCKWRTHPNDGCGVTSYRLRYHALSPPSTTRQWPVT